MKKVIGFIAITCFSVVNLTAQTTRLWKLYDYHLGNYIETSVSDYTTVDDAKDIIQNIIAVVGLKPKFEIKAANIPNAAAVIYNSKRFILYNPTFVATLNKAASNQWASVSILAHEIGHHLNGHTLEAGGSNPEIELEADEFSGFVLQKMGATLDQAQIAMKIAASQRESHTHPAQASRLFAIAKGWNNARSQASGSNSDVAKKYEKAGTTTMQPPVAKISKPVVANSSYPIAENYILKDVVFNADRSSAYYITTRNNVVIVKNNSLAIVGKMSGLDNRDFPLIIYDERNNYLLVNKYGAIVTKQGVKVGYIKEHI